jgi:orotidine-5'-phosphate decarboxylase
MTYQELSEQIFRKKSYLCVGLDTDLSKLPSHLLREPDPIFAFNRQIIEATADYCVAYKPNIAFYEALGPKGWESLQKTLEIIPPTHFTIADAKRGDIGNTSTLYARTFFEKESSGLSFDSVTVAPYMGHDSVLPFLEFEGKWVILLALTSNPGSADFQHLATPEGTLYEQVLRVSQTWANHERLMYVVGATNPTALRHIRSLVPQHFLLVPGVGAQGGSLAEVSEAGLNAAGGLLVNASRSILYAGSGTDFAEAARQEARSLQQEMARYLQAFS